jgi:hypothetical protein
MAAIEWHHGAPPDAMRGKRLLIIGYPMNRNYFDDNRPDIVIGHFHETEGTFVPARISGMSEDQARPDLNVLYWADIDLPEGVELSPLKDRHLKG